MSFDYDQLYRETPQALGAPTQVFVDYFEDIPPPKRVLDIGCGQGRDALFIAALGHSVVGVDLSPAGIDAMVADAAKQGLDVTGFAKDIRTFEPDGLFDILLIDRTLHMLEIDDQVAVLARLLDHVAPQGDVLIADERSNMAGFRKVFAASARSWDTLRDKGGYLFQRAL